MSSRDILREEVKDIKLGSNLSVYDLVRELGSAGGFMATHLYEAAEILYEMSNDKDCYRIISFTGNLISTGLRGVIAKMIGDGLFDAIITTGGALDHDVARGFGGKYYKGFFNADDVMLFELNIHRLGNVFIPVESYGPLIEKVIFSILDSLPEGEYSPSRIAYEIGKRMNDEYSFLRQAYLRNVPVYVPGIVDSAVGTQLFFYSQTRKIKLNMFEDMKRILDSVFEAKKLGALIIGGGISKHHTIWWAQFKDGLNYSVYVTTASEYDGSLSGAQPREAITWGKINPKAKHITLYCDATICLPIIAQYVFEKKVRGV
ncbi:MAG: deoxyhypusine synthase [Thermoprotei archaeon]